MKQGKTSSGFEYKISDEALDDWELIEALSDVDKGNQAAIVDVVKKLFDDGGKALKEHCRTENGRVSLLKVSIEVNEIFSGISKNS